MVVDFAHSAKSAFGDSISKQNIESPVNDRLRPLDFAGGYFVCVAGRPFISER